MVALSLRPSPLATSPHDALSMTRRKSTSFIQSSISEIALSKSIRSARLSGHPQSCAALNLINSAPDATNSRRRSRASRFFRPMPEYSEHIRVEVANRAQADCARETSEGRLKRGFPNL